MFGKSPRQLLLFTVLALSYPSFILASPAPASAQFSNMVVHDSRDAVPQGFVIQGPTSPEKTINIRIAMSSNNMAGLEERLYAVSTPGSADYGKHLSKEDVSLLIPFHI
jgi:tripeptidyl-peptidase-1